MITGSVLLPVLSLRFSDDLVQIAGTIFLPVLGVVCASPVYPLSLRQAIRAALLPSLAFALTRIVVLSTAYYALGQRSLLASLRGEPTGNPTVVSVLLIVTILFCLEAARVAGMLIVAGVTFFAQCWMRSKLERTVAHPTD